LKLFAALCEAFSSAYPDSVIQNKTEILNKTTIQLVTKFWDTGSVICHKCLSNDKTAEIVAVRVSSSASAAIRTALHQQYQNMAAKIQYHH
jgi:hypothetical protein